jgi:hypothetical protein
MASISKECSISQAFNYQKDDQSAIGHVAAIKIADKELKADLKLTDPEDITKKLDAVGAISSFHWEGGAAQPLQFTFNISITNKNTLAVLLHSDLSSILTVVDFVIWEYDPEQKTFFKVVHSNATKLNCLLQVEGNERQLYLSDEPGMEVEQPQNYQVVVSVVPEDKAQELHFAVSVSDKMVKQFGIERA